MEFCTFFTLGMEVDALEEMVHGVQSAQQVVCACYLQTSNLILL